MMKIKRTYKETSLRAGKVEWVDEITVREIALHCETRCNNSQIGYSSNPEQVIDLLVKGRTVETFFSSFTLGLRTEDRIHAV